MAVPCPTCLTLDCFSDEDTNLYSLEQGLFPFVIECPPGFDCNNPDQFNMVCCGQLLSAQFPPNATIDDKQTIIQALVNQCAVRLSFCGQDNNPDTPHRYFYNRDKECTVFCPDGSPFVFIVKAGTFVGTDQDTVDKQAADFACVQAGLRKVCLAPISACLCVGSPFSYTLQATGGIHPFVWSVFSGALPNGLSLDQTGTISGTPTTNGLFTFTIQVTEPDGSYMRKPYTMTVLEITTASIDGFTVGTPYSFQLQVAGGSGNYAWAITSGTLPDGLTMSITGLITGTPTTASSASLTFNVVDTSCEAATQGAFPPLVKLSTSSTTTIATVIGFPEYPGFESSPPKKYHTLTWGGTSEQQLWANGVQIAGAKVDYGGSSNIDTHGNYTSLYTKELSSMCSATGNLVTTFLPGVNAGLQNYVFTGWLGPAGHQKCPPPGIPYSDVGNVAIGKGNAATQDFSNFWGSKNPNPALSNIQVSNFNAVSATQGACVDAGGDPNANVFIALFEPVPQGVIPPINNTTQGTVWFFAGVVWNHNYSSVLSNEYTDAEALANAQVITGNGATAQNAPRTTGFVSRFTTVAFQLQCSNLLVGKDYIASYDLWDQTAGTTTTIQVGFTAAATTKVINGTVPNPVVGHLLTVRNPKIIFTQ